MPYPVYGHTLLSNFNGSNEDPISEGGKWANVSGWPANGARVSNQITGGSGAGFWSSRYAVAQLENFEVTVPVTVANNAGGNFTIDIGVRVLGPGGIIPTLANRNGYFLLWNSEENLSLERLDAGSPTAIASNTGLQCVAGDTIGIQCIDSDIKMWHDAGSLGSYDEVLFATSATYTIGWLLIGGFGVITDTAFDNITLGLPQGVSLREVQVRHSRGVAW